MNIEQLFTALSNTTEDSILVATWPVEQPETAPTITYANANMEQLCSSENLSGQSLETIIENSANWVNSIQQGTNITTETPIKDHKTPFATNISLTKTDTGENQALLVLHKPQMQILLSEKEQEIIETTQKTTQARLDFFTNISHELRTPINGIIGFVEILRAQLANDEQKHALDSIQGSTLNLLNILNGVINQSKYNADELEVTEEVFRLENIIDTVKDTFEPEIHEKGLNFSIDLQFNTPPWLVGDASHIKQIILNLISNACKFTEDGQIQLQIKWQDDTNTLDITVKDTGCGIPKEFQDQLYNCFAQADNSLTRKVGGLGLGLSVTHALTTLMDGTISFESTRGEGSSFTVSLPLKHPTKEQLSFLQLDEDSDDVSNDDPLKSFDTKNMNTLVVEDNHVNQMMMEGWLGKMGFGTIHIANNGFESLSLLRNNTYDIILMDCQMPELDGYETTTLIRDMEKNLGTETPIVAVTANASLGEREKCLECGMNDYLTKPTNYNVLRDHIAKWLYNSRDGHDTTTKTTADQTQSISLFFGDEDEDDINLNEPQNGGDDDMNCTASEKPATTTSEEPVDIEIINDFTEGDMDIERTLVEIFVKTGWDYVQKMKSAIQSGEHDQWVLHSHSLKGASANLGAHKLTQLCQIAENETPAENTPEKETILADITNEFEIVRDFLESRHA